MSMLSGLSASTSRSHLPVHLDLDSISLETERIRNPGAAGFASPPLRSNLVAVTSLVMADPKITTPGP
ncbi:hypothetical protein FRB94_007856 [Tulasnella sp. JGI-2019a]|nr:hypothetical protein FRB94_007856 [Tulasnella sp. JGI-2019a]KAG9032256.1 hypothetical protein FRB95_001652 [Tulasnella sp. JGI-2019a]